MQLAEGLAQHERQNQEMALQSSSLTTQSNSLQQRCQELTGKLAEREAALQALQTSFNNEIDRSLAQRAQLELRLQESEVQHTCITAVLETQAEEWPVTLLLMLVLSRCFSYHLHMQSRHESIDLCVMDHHRECLACALVFSDGSWSVTQRILSFLFCTKLPQAWCSLWLRTFKSRAMKPGN